MKLIQKLETIAELRSAVSELKRDGKTIGVVPTMGALHEGHLSLANASLSQTDVTIATIFLNPSQFAPSEDLAKYPKTLDDDLAKLEQLGVDYAFVPTENEIYPEDFTTKVLPPDVSRKLEGEFRPHHFGGVCTVVLKLLNITQPDIAFFGQKDFQQVAVIKQMVRDLNVPTKIEVCPIVRDENGLALSSRNVYLSPEEREIALSLSRTLEQTKAAILDGQTDGFELITEMRQSLIDAGVTSIDYATVANPRTLTTMDQIEKPVVLLIAAYVGSTRLIDNCLIE